MKRTLCILLSLMLAMTGLVGLGVPASAYDVGDIILFGNYPQTKVSETTALKNAANAATWKSYGYYVGTGSYDGNMAASDFMKYADFSLNGVKYRAVRFTEYRPWNTALTTDDSEQIINGYYTNTTYYFRYEPLEWRVLDPDFGLVMCETIIDSQAYQNVVKKSASDNYYIGTTATYANNYAESSIRTWLNKDFYNTAFNTAQKNNIIFATSHNAAFSTTYSQYDAVSTTNPISLLSYSEAQISSFGLSSNDSRKAKGTDYAKCQGLFVRDSGFSAWLLRSAGSASDSVCNVSSNGSIFTSYNVTGSSYGIRPACCLMNLTSDVSQSMIYTVTATADQTAGGTVTGGGTYSAGQTATLNATANSGYIFSGWYNGSTKVSSNKSYTFTVTENVTLTAKFYPLSMTYKVTATANPAEGGTVTGGGSYSAGKTATVTATPKNGWHFIGWFDGSNKVSSDASYSFTVTGNVTLTAKFEKDSYTVTVSASPAEGGTVTGGGDYYKGDTATVTATPNSGWYFTAWYDKTGALASTQQSYSISVFGNRSYYAKFKKDTQLNVPQSATVGYKSTVTVTATAEDMPEGYFVALYDGETQLAKGDKKAVSYTMTKKMTESKTLTAKVIDVDGNVQSNADGKLEKEIKITVKTGFFDKVKAFFLGLFGLLPKVELKP